MSDDRESGATPQSEHRASEDGTAPTSADEARMSPGPHSGSTFSLRVQPDRRRSSTPIDPARERRRR